MAAVNHILSFLTPHVPLAPSPALDAPYARDSWGVGCLLPSYVLETKIGEGTYGKVYIARDTRTGERVALKKIKPHHEEEGFPKTETREIKILATHQHPNMVQLREFITDMSVAGLREAAAARGRQRAEAAAAVLQEAVAAGAGGGGGRSQRSSRPGRAR